MAAKTEFVSAGFGMLRTPLLPYETILRLSEELSPTDAQGTQEGLAARLEVWFELAAERTIREALALASPALVAALDKGTAELTPADARRMERSLCRYISRMAWRPTPFGLFAGVSHVRCGSNTTLTVPAKSDYRRRSRLDMDVVLRMVEALESDPAIRDRVRFYSNPTLYRLNGSLRYIQSRRSAAGLAH
jgi:hypothetical protein